MSLIDYLLKAVITEKTTATTAAIMLIATNIAFARMGMKTPKEAFEDLRPGGWGRESCWKIMDKPVIGQLQVLGALAAAEIDRLQNLCKH
ncbi:MAG: hypothetical protein LLG05_14455 [Porphyromonadaceae bacterium]|nr:hypothetical protein [Porphyromonadaceae bacterium]